MMKEEKRLDFHRVAYEITWWPARVISLNNLNVIPSLTVPLHLHFSLVGASNTLRYSYRLGIDCRDASRHFTHH